MADWLEAYLRLPTGEPFIPTDEQLEKLVRWYALHPRTGRRIHRRGQDMEAKGKGKSPLWAGVSAVELAGPAVFDGWDADGEPVGRPWLSPWCQIAAVSEEQTDNTYGALYEMLQLSPAADDLGLDVGLTRICLRDRPSAKIEAVTASSGAREGARITWALLDETHLWFPPQGKKLAATLRRNVGKMGGTSVETTNAPELGRQSVAEATRDGDAKGVLQLGVEGVYVADVKAPANREKVIEALGLAYGDSAIERGGWVDLERIYEEILDPETSEDDAIRFYLNVPRKAANRAFDMAQFAKLATDREIARDVPVVLAFDGARTRDCAVLSAWTVEDVPHHFRVAVWERPYAPQSDYEHPRNEIRGEVVRFMADHRVVIFAYDSSFHELNSLYDEWLEEYGEADPERGIGLMVPFPTASGQRMEKAILRLIEDTRAGLYSHDGDDIITAHVRQAVLTRNRSGYLSLAKEKDSMKIDGAVTMTFGYDLLAVARVMNDRRSTAPQFFIEFS